MSIKNLNTHVKTQIYSFSPGSFRNFKNRPQISHIEHKKGILKAIVVLTDLPPPGFKAFPL